jgi:hypothetical protein
MFDLYDLCCDFPYHRRRPIIFVMWALSRGPIKKGISPSDSWILECAYFAGCAIGSATGRAGGTGNPAALSLA